MKPQRQQYKIKENVTLKNIFNTGDIIGDIINEEEIEGKPFYVVRSNNRVLKLSKEAYLIRKTK
jgi:hypothetical protein